MSAASMTTFNCLTVPRTQRTGHYVWHLQHASIKGLSALIFVSSSVEEATVANLSMRLRSTPCWKNACLMLSFLSTSIKRKEQRKNFNTNQTTAFKCLSEKHLVVLGSDLEVVIRLHLEYLQVVLDASAAN